MQLIGCYGESFMAIGPEGLSFDYDTAPFVCALGDNGAGKSGVLRDLVMWVLEGKTAKGLTASDPATTDDTVINRFAVDPAGTVLGEAFFLADDGTLWAPRRFVAKKKASAKLYLFAVAPDHVAAWPRASRSLHELVVAHGEEKSDAARKDVQSEVTALAGHSMDILQQQVFLSRWGVPLARMTSAEQQDVFNQITGAGDCELAREGVTLGALKAEADLAKAKTAMQVFEEQEALHTASLARLEAACRDREAAARVQAERMRAEVAKKRATLQEEEQRLLVLAADRHIRRAFRARQPDGHGA